MHAAQSHLLNTVAAGGIQVMDLLPEDYARIAELNDRYADLPGDFADLTLVALSERFNLAEIQTPYSVFSVDRCLRRFNARADGGMANQR